MSIPYGGVDKSEAARLMNANATELAVQTEAMRKARDKEAHTKLGKFIDGMRVRTGSNIVLERLYVTKSGVLCAIIGNEFQHWRLRWRGNNWRKD